MTTTASSSTYGSIVGRKEFFGEFSRYAAFQVATRFGDTQWFVTDAERLDDLGLPAVIRQAASRAEALAGL